MASDSTTVSTRYHSNASLALLMVLPADYHTTRDEFPWQRKDDSVELEARK